MENNVFLYFMSNKNIFENYLLILTNNPLITQIYSSCNNETWKCKKWNYLLI